METPGASRGKKNEEEEDGGSRLLPLLFLLVDFWVPSSSSSPPLSSSHLKSTPPEIATFPFLLPFLLLSEAQARALRKFTVARKRRRGGGGGGGAFRRYAVVWEVGIEGACALRPQFTVALWMGELLACLLFPLFFFFLFLFLPLRPQTGKKGHSRSFRGGGRF